LHKMAMAAFESQYIDTMADVNVNEPTDQTPTMAPPTRTDDQTLPYIRWVTIRKITAIWMLKSRKAIQSIRLRKHNFHSRPDSPLHLPNEEPVLGYLKFIAKGTKREVFGMSIPGNLITAEIQGKPYYQEYLDIVAKHQRYLAGEQGSDPDSPASKPAKATKKSKPSGPKVDIRPSVIKLASSQQPEPKPAQAKSQGKKRKLVTEISDKPSPARKSRPGLVTYRCKPTSSLRSVDESAVEGIPEKEPGVDDEEADVHRALRTSIPTGSSGHDESSSLYDELRLTDSEVKSDEDVPGIDAGVPDEGHARPNPDDSRGTCKLYKDLVFLQHIVQDLSFGDLFFNDKPLKADNEKRTVETKVEPMVSITIQQDTSTIPPMKTPVSKAMDEIVTDAVDWVIQAPLQNRFRDLPEADIKEILHQRMWETNSYKTHEDHMMLYEALEKSINHDHTEELLKIWMKHAKRRKRDVIHQKCHMGLHLISHLLLHHQQVHLELQDLLELLDHHKCRHHLLHLLHLHLLTKKVNHMALTHQALQRQLSQLNIKLGQRLTQELGRLSHRPLKISIWIMIWLSMHKYTRLMMKTSGMPIFPR
nr:hypothetical protein [Tanacetum cinerariifolium]